MTFRQLAIAAALGTAFVAAHANVVTSTNGATTTYTENFNGSTSFSGGFYNAPLTSDDYLWLGSTSPTSTTSSSFTFNPGALASATVSFWYSASSLFSSNPGAVTFQMTNDALGGTANVVTFALNNPGSSTDGLFDSGTADQFVSFNFDNLSAGPYTLSFATNGVADALKIDDLTIATVAAVPEPETYALMLAGLVAVGFMSRRRKTFN